MFDLKKLFSRRPNFQTFDSGMVSAFEIADSLSRRHLVLVKNVLEMEKLATIRLHANDFVNRVAKFRDNNEVPAEVIFSATNRSFPLEMITSEPLEHEGLLDLISNSAIVEIMATYFKTAQIHLRSPNCRFHDPDVTLSHLPWHQDGFNLPHELEAINCWLPLSEGTVGRDIAGLEFLSVVPDEILERELEPQTGNYGFLEPNTVKLSNIMKRAVPWQPKMLAGDVLLFDKHVMHRTHSKTDMVGRRISAELRFLGNDAAAQKSLTGDKLPYLEINIQDSDTQRTRYVTPDGSGSTPAGTREAY